MNCEQFAYKPQQRHCRRWPRHQHRASVVASWHLRAHSAPATGPSPAWTGYSSSMAQRRQRVLSAKVAAALTAAATALVSSITYSRVVAATATAAQASHTPVTLSALTRMRDVNFVVAFYDGSVGGDGGGGRSAAEALAAGWASAARDTAADAFGTPYVVDVAAAANREAAEQQQLVGVNGLLSAAAGRPLVFVHSVYDGNTEYVHADTSAGAVARWAALYLAVGNPDNVTQFTTEDDFLDLIDGAASPRPVFVWFSSFTSPQCARMRPAFAAAAAYLAPAATFLEVRCAGRGSTVASRTFCRRRGVSEFPTLALFTGEGWLPYDLPTRTAGDFDVFLARAAAAAVAPASAPPPLVQQQQQVAADVAPDGTVSSATPTATAAPAVPVPVAAEGHHVVVAAVLERMERTAAALQADIAALRAALGQPVRAAGAPPPPPHA